VIWRIGAAATIALVAAGCGGGGDSSTTVPKGKDVARGAVRFESPDVVLEAARRPARRRITLDGNRFRGGHDWLLPVEMKLTNRRKRRLTVGQITATVTGHGGQYVPIYADGRATAAPVFAERSVARGEAVNTLVLFRVPKKALRPTTFLRVQDPERGAAYKLRLF
jgi:hypothetical protein